MVGLLVLVKQQQLTEVHGIHPEGHAGEEGEGGHIGEEGRSYWEGGEGGHTGEEGRVHL